MATDAILKVLGDHIPAEEIIYAPYSIADTKIMYGIPAQTVVGLDYIVVRHNHPQTKCMMGLTGAGLFATNRNQSGIVEIGLLSGTISCGGFDAMDILGIPFPLAIVDKACGGSSGIVATACKRVGTPEWARRAAVGVDVYTFESPRLLIAHGLRLPVFER